MIISDEAVLAMGQYRYKCSPNNRKIDVPTISALTSAGKLIPVWIRPNWLTMAGAMSAWMSYIILRLNYIPKEVRIDSS